MSEVLKIVLIILRQNSLGYFYIVSVYKFAFERITLQNF